MKSKTLLLFALIFSTLIYSQITTGEFMRWHKITLSFNGPNTSETATVNPFSDYRLTVLFTHNTTGTTYEVPGFYSGCNNPSETSCDSGDIWKVHFTPDRIGEWQWSASFTTGTDVAINGGGNNAGFMDGSTGSITVLESDKSGRDFRSASKGRLKYVGEHYLKHIGNNPDDPNGNWFVKAGADAPENTLAYEDFDNTPNRGNRRKNWNPHQQDYVTSDASDYTWNNGKGSELLGVVNYLANKGVNAFSFLTLSLHGDDENVFPHLLKVSETVYNGYNDGQQWNLGVYKDRFDISKMAQWERIFEYADKKGVYMHFKTMETENDNIMDGNSFGRERKLYYRELIARFGHHLALNWNLTEETTLPDQVAISTSNYINDLDPYGHNIVLHTYPNQQTQRYTPLLGNNSSLTGASIQIGKNQVHDMVKEWINKSSNAGKKWVVANDEQGSANIGVDADPNDNKLVRHRVLWGTLMAGGAGVEYYYGYQTNGTDLDAQNHRTRDSKYTHANHALDFFNNYLQSYLIDMTSQNALTTDTNDYVFAKEDEIYVVYRPDGGSTNINLPAGSWNVEWYNPRTGGALSTPSEVTNTITAPDSNDWVALITGNSNTNPGCDNTTTVDAAIMDDAYLQGTTSFNTNELRTESNNRTTYLKFTVPNSSETLSSAKLVLTVATDSGSGLIEIYKGSTNNWTETTLSESNKPLEDGLLGSLNTTFSLNQSFEWQLSGITAGETISLIVKQVSGNDVSFSSKEGANIPRLILEYGDCEDTSTTCAALEQNGIVAIEAEHYDSLEFTDVRNWYLTSSDSNNNPSPDPDPNHSDSASGNAYLEILPDTRVTHSDPLINNENFTNTAGQMTMVNYKVQFETTGRYYVWVRAYSTGTEDNGVHVGLDGNWPSSGERMQWCSGKNQWTWESKQRTADEHCGVEQLIYLDINTVGIHTISFSMREDGFEMDKIVLNKEYVKPNGAGPAEQLVNCGTLSSGDFDQQDESKVKIYPNPASSIITVDNINSKGNVYDMFGRQLLSDLGISESNKIIDISNLPSGVYFLRFENKQVIKFIKQ